MELHLKVTGILLIVLAIIHTFFPSYFNWKEELKPLSLLNRQLMYVHTFFIALAILLMGLFCFFYADDIINNALGRKVSLGLGIFWGIRLVFQFFVYSPLLWKGKKFETTMHILFSALWCYLTVLFLAIYFR